MAKFAVGQLVDNAADDHESGTVVPVFQQSTIASDTLSIWKATACSSSLQKKNWAFTPLERNALDKGNASNATYVAMPFSRIGSRKVTRRAAGTTTSRAELDDRVSKTTAESQATRTAHNHEKAASSLFSRRSASEMEEPKFSPLRSLAKPSGSR